MACRGADKRRSTAVLWVGGWGGLSSLPGRRRCCRRCALASLGHLRRSFAGARITCLEVLRLDIPRAGRAGRPTAPGASQRRTSRALPCCDAARQPSEPEARASRALNHEGATRFSDPDTILALTILSPTCSRRGEEESGRAHAAQPGPPRAIACLTTCDAEPLQVQALPQAIRRSPHPPSHPPMQPPNHHTHHPPHHKTNAPTHPPTPTHPTTHPPASP